METLKIIIPERMLGQRLDLAISVMLPDLSRSKIAAWIKSGDALINDKTFKPKDKVVGNEIISLFLNQNDNVNWLPEAVNLDIIFEDDHIIVLISLLV